MLKSIVKELIIILLLILAIVLVLGVFLYDYIPTSKIIPKTEAYQMPNNIKEELDATISDDEKQKTQIVYEINGNDLKKDEKSKDYQKGKVNPFSQDTIGSSNNTSNGTTNKGSTNSNSVGNYLPDTGTK